MKFIAEIGSNHNQDINRCMELIDTAAAIGCDGVKFQFFRIETLYAPEILDRSAEHRALKDRELPFNFLPLIHERCKANNLELGITPFAISDIDVIRPYVDFIKVASYELLWLDFIQAVADTRLPVVLSTGMATMEEVRAAVLAATGSNSGFISQLTLLHCVSGYPAPPEYANLRVIEALRERFLVKIGYSDHTVSRAVIYRAAHRWGADMIEFHLDLDGEGFEFSHGHCWLPDQIEGVIRSVRSDAEMNIYDGDGEKRPQPCEIDDRRWRADPADGLRPRISAREGFKA
jgi:sialic acid synthase SpsE